MSSLMTIQNAGTNVFRVLDTNITSVLGTEQSTSNTSGALVIAGGAGISKNLYVGGNIVVSGSLSTASGAFDGVQTYTATQTSTNSTTGALAVINGGIGIGTTADATSETSGGGLTVRGGGAFGARVFIGGDAGLRSNLTVTGTSTLVGTTSILSALNVSGTLIGSSDATIVGRIFGNSTIDSTHATSNASVVIAGGMSVARAASIGTTLRIGTLANNGSTHPLVLGYGSSGGTIGFERSDGNIGPRIEMDITQQLNFLNFASNNLRTQFRFINAGNVGHMSRDSGVFLNNFQATTVSGMTLRLATLGRLTTDTNYEFLNIANDSTGSWILSSAAAGTGFLRPIGLQVQNNNGQLLLETSGNVSMANQLTVSTDLVVGTTKITPNPGDLAVGTMSLTNNQSAAANVTGLAFANATVRSFVAQVSVSISATTSLFTVYTLQGVQRGSDWVMSSSFTGDVHALAFTMTSAGQVQYTTPSYAGFSSGTLKFRATTLPV